MRISEDSWRFFRRLVDTVTVWPGTFAFHRPMSCAPCCVTLAMLYTGHGVFSGFRGWGRESQRHGCVQQIVLGQGRLRPEDRVRERGLRVLGDAGQALDERASGGAKRIAHPLCRPGERPRARARARAPRRVYVYVYRYVLLAFFSWCVNEPHNSRREAR